MKNYVDLIEQTFDFPSEEFRVENHELRFHHLDLMEIIRQYGTPLKLSYLPRISEKIQNAKKVFERAIQKHDYQGNYHYAYCTKSSHFKFVLDEALKNGIHIETSSAFDIPIVRHLAQNQKIDKSTLLICNGYKRPAYLRAIRELLEDGYNCYPILDNLQEIEAYESLKMQNIPLGIRMASDEEPNAGFYTSRLGVRYTDVMGLYQEKIKPNPHFSLKMLHFFINTGIRDSAYYWRELSRFVSKYCELRKICPELEYIDIGGGFPIRTSLQFAYDYAQMADQIIECIQSVCRKHEVPEPHIFTEFGSYTVGESGAMIYSILDEKLQNEKELWYMTDGSFITHLPDIWALNQKYIMLAINNWDKPHHKVHLGGLTCDSMDYYNTEAHHAEVFLPQLDGQGSQYIGFFHTGAYQDALSGYGGLQHCLIPSPQHVIINRDKAGNIQTRLFAEEQASESMLRLLGYT